MNFQRLRLRGISNLTLRNMFKQPPTVMKKNPSIQALNVLAAKLFVCVSNGCTNLRIRRIFGAFLFDCNSLFGITGFGSMARGVNMPLRQIWIELVRLCEFLYITLSSRLRNSVIAIWLLAPRASAQCLKFP